MRVLITFHDKQVALDSVAAIRKVVRVSPPSATELLFQRLMVLSACEETLTQSIMYAQGRHLPGRAVLDVEGLFAVLPLCRSQLYLEGHCW